MKKLFFAFLITSLSACSHIPLLHKKEAAQPKSERFTLRSLNPFHRNPERIQTVGKKNINRLNIVLSIDPEDVKLTETRRLTVKAIISNPSRRALSLNFPTTQHQEIIIEDMLTGKTIVRWSDDRFFTPTLGHVTINPSERIEFKESISLRDVQSGKTYRITFSVPGYPELTKTFDFTPR